MCTSGAVPSIPNSTRSERPFLTFSARAPSGKRVLSVLLGSQSRIVLRADQISPVMKQAIVAIEDKRFYEHRGVDVHGIMRAVWADVRNKAVVEGGSTITQQFVKNTYTK